eukprot:1173909-Pleurochrysis_carterae.AAC.1
MHARSGISQPHALGAVICRCGHGLHDCCVDRSNFGFAAQVHNVVIERCVAAGDECHEHEDQAAQR